MALNKALTYHTHTYIVSAMAPIDFRHAWAIFGPQADKNTQRGSLAGLLATEKFSGRFVYV